MPKERFHEHYRFLNSTERLSFGEIVRLVRLFAASGVRKLRLTGGEPLLRTNLPELIGDLSGVAGIEELALTTNGMLLAKHAIELKSNGLHRVTVSLDSLNTEVFARMSGGLGSVPQVLEGIEAAIAAGFSPVKINAVVERGVNDHTVLDLIEHFRGRPVIVRLIEFMDVGNRNGWHREKVVPTRELIERCRERWPMHAAPPTRMGETSTHWRFDDGSAEIGFIASVTQAFCADCNRARLSSEGKLFTCLFASNGVDLRSSLRSNASDETLLGMIQGCWKRRIDRYSEQREDERRASSRDPKIEMYYIGG